MIIMKFSCVAVANVGKGSAADQEQDGCDGEYGFMVKLLIFVKD